VDVDVDVDVDVAREGVQPLSEYEGGTGVLVADPASGDVLNLSMAICSH